LKEKKNILISPLNWGLGHAARIIPVARYFINHGHKVSVAAGEPLRSFLESELPGTPFIQLDGFCPAYSGILPQYLILLLQTPVLIWKSAMEHFIVKKIIKENKIDILISDNRFGLWNKRIKTVYITHMPRIPFPYPFRFLEFIGIAFHRFVMNRYTMCLIPDLPGDVNLSGRLSHGLKLPPNTRFAGILSRFRYPLNSNGADKRTVSQIAVVLSGPEPQRSILAGKLGEILPRYSIPVKVLHGQPGLTAERSNDNVINFTHLPAPDIQDLLLTSRYIIGRSGYTTIMELACLQKTAVLIPTPGQTEQEYLCNYLTARNYFSGITQGNIGDLVLRDSSETSFPLSAIEESDLLFNEAAEEILKEDN
jgi:hypothetical protein